MIVMFVKKLLKSKFRQIAYLLLTDNPLEEIYDYNYVYNKLVSSKVGFRLRNIGSRKIFEINTDYYSVEKIGDEYD